MTVPTAVRRARRAYLVVAVAIPLVLTAVAVAFMLVWLPSMPATVATHWNAAGTADRFGPTWVMPVLAAAFGVFLSALFGVIGVLGSRGGGWGPTMRFLGSLALGVIALLLTLMTTSFAAQRGLSEAPDAPSLVVPLLAGFVVGIAAGVIGWFAQPKLTVSGAAAATTVPPIPLGRDERAVWVRTTTMAGVAMVAILAATGLMVVLAIAFALTGFAMWWLMAGLAVLLTVIAATTFVFRVRVSDAGLRVASSIGIPRWIIPLSDVATVTVTDVQPMVEFGGWGIRIALDGRFGIVLREGPALQVTRTDGRRFVVTVADAATGAALLEALRARDAAAHA